MFGQLTENEQLYTRQRIKFKQQSREQSYNHYFRPEKFFLRK